MKELKNSQCLRSMSAVYRADVVLIVIDATEGVTEQDTKVAGIAHDEGKACVFVINKWDLIEKDNKTLGNYTNEVKKNVPIHDVCTSNICFSKN